MWSLEKCPEKPCTECGGSGSIVVNGIIETCPLCGGSGTIPY